MPLANQPQESSRFWKFIYARAVWLPTLAWNVLLGRVLKRRRWWDEVDDFVVIGALPFPGDVSRLAALGVTGVVNTCEEYAGPQSRYKQADIEQLRVPTIDFTHPSLESVILGVDFIGRHAERGGKVYVHCKAGRGRSATVVMGWLMRKHGMSPDEAQARLSSVRPHVNQKLAQRPVVLEFQSHLESSGQ